MPYKELFRLFISQNPAFEDAIADYRPGEKVWSMEILLKEHANTFTAIYNPETKTFKVIP